MAMNESNIKIATAKDLSNFFGNVSNDVIKARITDDILDTKEKAAVFMAVYLEKSIVAENFPSIWPVLTEIFDDIKRYYNCNVNVDLAIKGIVYKYSTSHIVPEGYNFDAEYTSSFVYDFFILNSTEDKNVNTSIFYKNMKAEADKKVNELIDEYFGSTMNKDFAAEFASLRSRTGLSVEGFAEKYGIPKGEYERWELRRAQPPVYVFNMVKKLVTYADNNPVKCTTLIDVISELKEKYGAGVIKNPIEIYIRTVDENNESVDTLSEAIDTINEAVRKYGSKPVLDWKVISEGFSGKLTVVLNLNDEAERARRIEDFNNQTADSFELDYELTTDI